MIDRSWDGMSARTLDAVRNYGWSAHPSRPYDPSDFGRCYNWMKLYCDDKIRFKALLIDVKKLYPEWTATADNWNELERLYLEETANETNFGKASKLYAFMEKINSIRK